jgi:hypothetical protein
LTTGNRENYLHHMDPRFYTDRAKGICVVRLVSKDAEDYQLRLLVWEDQPMNQLGVICLETGDFLIDALRGADHEKAIKAMSKDISKIFMSKSIGLPEDQVFVHPAQELVDKFDEIRRHAFMTRVREQKATPKRRVHHSTGSDSVGIIRINSRTLVPA